MGEVASYLTADAPLRTKDPTGTAGIRRSFRNAGKLRVNQLRAHMRVAVMDHDVLGIGSAGVMAYHAADTRLRAFSSWLDVTAHQVLDGPWLSWGVAKAWSSGEVRAAAQLGTSPAGESSAHILELAKVELDGIKAAIVQQVSREAAAVIARPRFTRSQAWRRLSAALDKVGPPRIMALANTITVDAHNRAKIATYRSSGVGRVGIVPEVLKPHVHASLLRHDAQDAKPDWLKGQGGRFAGSRTSIHSEPDSEINKLWSAYKKSGAHAELTEYSEAMLDRCRAIAKDMRLDPGCISASDIVQKGSMGTTLASTDMAGTKIVMFSRVCDPKTFPGTLVHEITHIKYTALRNEFKKQRDQVSDALSTMSPQEHEATVNPDGTLNGPLAQKYPIYNEFTSIYDLTELQKEGGVSSYSRQWWDKTKGGHYLSSAVYETLSEMARKRLETGELPGGPRHQALYALMNSYWFKHKPPGYADKAEFEEEKHPRGKSGLGTPGSFAQSTGPHPGLGYSPAAWLDKTGVIHTNSVYDAQRALFENRRVELAQIKQVSTLIQRLGETAKEMAEAGHRAPVFNLCNVSIKGTNLFCAQSKGIPRVKMPVIPGKRVKEFVHYLIERGYFVKKTTERAGYLRATQDELSGAKVAAAVEKIKDRGEVYKRIIVSRDDYILDGHHTWAGQLAIDAASGTLHADKSVPVARVDISITKLIAEADKWMVKQGLSKKPVSEQV